jgi:thermitase
VPKVPSVSVSWWRSILLSLLLAALVHAFVDSAVADSPHGHAPGGQDDELLVGLHGGVSESDADDAHRKVGARKIAKVHGLNVHRVAVSAGWLEATEEALARDPRIKFVERNRAVSPDFVVSDPSFASQWHLAKIAAPKAWDLAPGATGIVVAVVDSGVDGAHPDLSSRMVPGYNFYSNNTNTSDVHGHGTWVAGTVAAAGNNTIGVAGVAWQAKVMPIRVSNSSGVAYISAIANGIIWAADHGARVVNASFSGLASSPTISNAAQYARSKGAVFVASAGNCGCLDGTPENPYVLSVGATDANDSLASFSSRGNYVDLSAPGTSILTTNRGGGYVRVQGTSFSSPVVAGVIALMRKANGTLSAADLVTLVKANADDRGAAGWDSSFGYGRVNAWRAVAAAVGSVSAPDTTLPTVAITSPAGGTVLSNVVTVGVSASDNGSISRVELYIDGALYASDTAAPYSFSWDTRQAINGPHVLVAKAVDAAGNIRTSATVTTTVSNNLADATRPVVAITGTSISNGYLSVSVSATDNVAVKTVALYVDNRLVSTRMAPPYQFSVNLSAYAVGSHQVVAAAYDAVWNVGMSTVVVFSKTASVAGK